jgi:hypothetical protein
VMDTISAGVFLALLVAFLGWFYGPWQTFCVDRARERMFEVRNSLFDMAADGRLSFQSSSYRELRRRIESNIRFAHRMSWPTLVILHYGIHRVFTPRRNSLEGLIAALPDAGIRTIVQKEMDSVTHTVLRLIMYRSIFLLLLFTAMNAARHLGAPVFYFCRMLADKMIETAQDEAIAVDERRVSTTVSA